MSFLHKFPYLILSGGGLNGSLLIGSLLFHISCGPHTFINNLRGIAGTSIGSLIAYLICLGISVEEMYYLFKEHCCCLHQGNISMDLLHKDGALYDQEIFRKILCGLTVRKFSTPYLTFEQLREQTGKDLVINACCVNTGQTCIFRATTHPTTLIIPVILASMAIPLVFPPVEINGQLYVDGGLQINVLLGVFPLEKTLVWNVSDYKLIPYPTQILKASHTTYAKAIVHCIYEASNNYTQILNTCLPITLITLAPGRWALAEPTVKDIDPQIIKGWIQAFLYWSFTRRALLVGLYILLKVCY